MRKIIFCCLACWMAVNLMAADGKWLTSLPVAQAQARKEHRLILMDFTGSDWCPACIKLEADVLSKPEFQSYANKNLVLVLVDFPLGKPQSKELQAANEALQEKYKVEGYPTIVVTKPNGAVVWRQETHSPGEGPSPLISKLEEIRKK
jgi:thioredoxin-related protein